MNVERVHASNSLKFGYVDHVRCSDDYLSSLYISKKFSDVTLIVDGHRFEAHKLILASRSKYFESLFFGGLRETTQSEIELKGITPESFKLLLNYAYTFKLYLGDKEEDALLELIHVTDLLDFPKLKKVTEIFLQKFLNVNNACILYQSAQLYGLQILSMNCSKFIDEHALEVMEHEDFLELNKSCLVELFARDTFSAPEINIFLAVYRWSSVNCVENLSEILDNIRFSLMTYDDIAYIVSPSKLLPPKDILDVFAMKTKPPSTIACRKDLILDENVANLSYGAKVIRGQYSTYASSGPGHRNSYLTHFCSHLITGSPDNDCIVIKLGKQYVLNHIKLLLYDQYSRCLSYYIQACVVENDWSTIIDYSMYDCHGWQSLYFETRRIQYFRIVGTKSALNNTFLMVHFESCYTSNPERVIDGIIVPRYNVARVELGAMVTDDQNQLRTAILNKKRMLYKKPTVPAKTITIRLGQPYIVNSMRFLLNDSRRRSYSYRIEVSRDHINWEQIVDATNRYNSSWQIIILSRPIALVYIRIVCTRSTAPDEELQVSFFECPATE